MDFPWADDVQTYLELGDNFALFKVTDEDAAALAEIRHAFDKKIEAEREKLSKASPRTRSRKLVRALSVQSPDPSRVEDEQEPRLSSAEVRKIQEETRKEEAKRRAAEQKKSHHARHSGAHFDLSTSWTRPLLRASAFKAVGDARRPPPWLARGHKRNKCLLCIQCGSCLFSYLPGRRWWLVY